jgi:hypothetical protein
VDVLTKDKKLTKRHPVVEETDTNAKTVLYALDALAVDLSIVVKDAREQEAKSQKGDSVRHGLTALYVLRSRVKHALDALDNHMSYLSYCQPEDQQSE